MQPISSRIRGIIMGDLEEALRRKYLLIDTWDVRHQRLLLVSFSILMFITYSAFLILLCSMEASITTSLLLLGSQIGLGLPATRAFYDFGVSARRMLKFYDAGIIRTDIESEDLRISIGDVPLIFERLDFQIRKYDSGAIDDLNDLAWFGIVLWAVISSAGIFTDFSGIPFCILSAVVLIILCFVCYISGYRTIQGASFEEDLNHLEYYVETCIKEIDEALPKVNGQVILQLTQSGKRWILIDIIIEFILPQDSVIEYHLGLSSQRAERVIIVAPPASVDTAYAKFKKLRIVIDAEWTLEQVTTQTGRILRIVNPETKLCICNRTSFVINPEHVKENVLASRENFSNIVSILNTVLAF